MEGVPAEHAGAASGLLQMDQQVGGALGLAIIAAVYAGSSVPGQFTVGLGTAFAVAAVISLLATLVAIRTVRPKAPSIGTEVPKPQAAHF